MEFFGLTQYGFSDPFKDLSRDDYKEPAQPVNLLEVEVDPKDPRKTFSERIKELDCYIGYADGYAYRSNDRLMRMRKKYVFKPVGPCEMYKYPGAVSMNHGWFTQDEDLKKQTETIKWYKPRTKHSRMSCEMTRFIAHCLRTDRSFHM